MSLVDRFNQIEAHVEDALNDYSEALEKIQKHEAPRMFGTMEESIRTEELGRWKRRIGIDAGFLYFNQLNLIRKEYATLYLGGHGESPWLPFSDGSWRKFPSTSGNPFISESLHYIRSFVSFYKRI